MGAGKAKPKNGIPVDEAEAMSGLLELEMDNVISYVSDFLLGV